MGRKDRKTKQAASDPVKKQVPETAIGTITKAVVFALGFLLYAATLSYDYVLDDKIAITGNQITKKGFDGIGQQFSHDAMDGFWADQYGVDVEDLDKDAVVSGGRYRPLSMVTFSIEWALFGDNPAVGHFVNAVLYGLTGLLLMVFLSRIMPVRPGTSVWRSPAFLITILYLVHPLHIEVVANIKSRDEILSFLFGLWSLDFVMRYIRSDERETKLLVFAAATLFLSLLSKETTIAFVAVAPLLLWFFADAKVADYKKVVGYELAAAALYLIIRFSVVGGMGSELPDELMNNPFLNATPGEKLATIFLIFAAYIKLLFIPYPLTHDYYPFHLPFMDADATYADWSTPAALAGVVLLGWLLWVILKGWKKKSVFAFLALFFLGTSVLTSNLFFPVGVFMNERFMYIPSLAFAWGVVYLLTVYLPEKKAGFKQSTGILVIVAYALAFVTIDFIRMPAWKDDYTLSLTDVEVSEGSAKANMGAGDAIIKQLDREKDPEKRKQMIMKAYGYLKKSLDIHPTYFPPLDLLGKLYYDAENYRESIRFYKLCAQRKPGNPAFVNNIYYIGNKLLKEKRYEEAVDAYETALELRPDDIKIMMALAEIYAQHLKNPGRAKQYMEMAYAVNPNNPDIIEKLGITYAMLNQFDKAIPLMEQTLKMKPDDPVTLRNLGVAYYQSGQIEKGQELIRRSEQMQAVSAGAGQ